MPILLLLLACSASDPAPKTRDDWARIALEDPDPRERLWAVSALEDLKDPELPGVILEGLKRHDRTVDPEASRMVGNLLLRLCMLPPNRCIPCESCPETAHPACREVDWDRKGCFAGEGDACPVPQEEPWMKIIPCDELDQVTDGPTEPPG